MKICWDNLEKLRYVKKSSLWCRKDNRRKRYKFIEHCQTCQEPFLASIDSKHNKGLFCTNKCQRNTEETKKKISLAQIGKKLTEEHKRKIGIKSLGKKHTEEARKKMSLAQKGKKLTEEHKNKLRNLRIGIKHTKEDILKFSGENSSCWKGGVTKKNISLYDTYAYQISYAESTRRDPKNNDLLQVKCTYCGKWYNPKTTSIRQRIGALEGRIRGEQRLYCSKECKKLCPTFGKVKYSAEETNTKKLSREVQAELRQLVFERDNWTCIKCGEIKALQCHHLKGILWEPIESADVDMCVTLCTKDHKKVHKKPGYRYSDLQCKK